MFAVYRDPDLSNKVLTACCQLGLKYCLYRKVLFIGDVKSPHEQWLGSSMLNWHGKAARDCASSSASEMVTEPTH